MTGSARLAAPRLALLCSLAACNVGGADSDTDTGITGASAASSSSSESGAMTMTTAGPAGSDSGTAGTATDGSTTGTKYDVGDTDGFDTTTAGGDLPPPSCKVGDELDAFGGCEDEAPPDSFEPEVQWSWTGPPGARYTFTIPLVANLTDDNDDGEIDLCDTPDVIVSGYPSLFSYGEMYALDGATGEIHFKFQGPVDGGITPALGDIDGDGLVEVIAGGQGNLTAFNHDGTILWQSTEGPTSLAAIALADIDNDGDVEILMGASVLDHEGKLVWTGSGGKAGSIVGGSATTAADLDGDGSLEVVMGPSAWFADGELFWLADEVDGGFPQVGDLDDDPYPEVLITNENGISMLEHDGTVKFLNEHPTPDLPQFNNWVRPACIHDFDGDGISEFAMSSQSHYSVFEGDLSVLWSSDVSDLSGIAAGTAFDFLGDGVAEAMYGDEDFSLIFDGLTGDVVLKTTRTSRTLIEYPIVADIDNDGSA
ncbi:MAG: VCBS repeat-containing protein, partial [Myxococcales bacterium]|nr:VCBS repeat-containing protein [Myxococcales bacterium]